MFLFLFLCSFISMFLFLYIHVPLHFEVCDCVRGQKFPTQKSFILKDGPSSRTYAYVLLSH